MITWKKSTCVHLCLQQNQKMIMPQKAQIQIALLDTPVTHEKQSHPEPQEIVCFNPDEIRETNVKFPSLCNFCLARPFTCTHCCLSSQLRYVHQCNLTAFASWKTTVSASEFSSAVSWLSGGLLAQSHDFRCMEPNSVLLNTVIPGWVKGNNCWFR